MKQLILGTRGSKLALAQTKIVEAKLNFFFPNIIVKRKVIKTKGDKIIDIPLTKINDKGFFVKEIQKELLEKKIDVAVHSMKDLPVLFEKTKISAVLERENACDVLLSVKKKKLKDFNKNDTIATTSIRRKIQINKLNKNVKIIDIRGNVDTRVNKMINGDCDGLLLAYAGVKRLGLEKYIIEYLNVNDFVPAPAQGAIALEINKDCSNIDNILAKINHRQTMIRVTAEKSFLRKIDGGCHLPFACYADIIKNKLHIHAIVASVDANKFIKKKISGSIYNSELLGEKLAQEIINSGGREIINEVKSKF